jgi:hypothetical protein
MLGLQATTVAHLQGITGAFVDGGASADTITDSGSGFITAGFAPGQVLFCTGATTSANDTAVTGAVIQGVAAGTITLLTGIVNTAEAFAAATIISAAEGGSLKDILRDGVLRIYSGSQPSSPDAAVSGTLLLEVSVDAGAFVHGAFDNGLEFGDAADGAISKASGETWQDTGIASGTAGWFRFVGNPTDDGSASTSLPRLDGNVGTSGADLNMSSTAVVAGSTYTIDSFTLTLPEYYGA